MESRANLTASDVQDMHLKLEIELRIEIELKIEIKLSDKMQIEKSGKKSKVR